MQLDREFGLRTPKTAALFAFAVGDREDAAAQAAAFVATSPRASSFDAWARARGLLV